MKFQNVIQMQSNRPTLLYHIHKFGEIKRSEAKLSVIPSMLTIKSIVWIKY